MPTLTRTPSPGSAVARMLGLSPSPPGTFDNGTISRIQDFCDRLVQKINGLLSLGSATDSSWAGNLDAQYLVVVIAAANTEQLFPHGLGRIPVAYVEVRRHGVSIVYDSGGGNWTDTALYLSSNLAGTYTLLIW